MKLVNLVFTFIFLASITSFGQLHQDKKHVIVLLDLSGSMQYGGMTDDDVKNWNSALSHLLFSAQNSTPGFKYVDGFEDNNISYPKPLLSSGDELTILQIGTSVSVLFDRVPYDGNSNTILSKLPSKITDFNHQQTNLKDAQEKFLEFIQDSYQPHAIILTDGENTIYNNNGNQATLVRNQYHIVTPAKYTLNKRPGFSPVFIEVLKVKSDPGVALQFSKSGTESGNYRIEKNINGVIASVGDQIPSITLRSGIKRDTIRDLTCWLVILDSNKNVIKEIQRKIDTRQVNSFPLEIDLVRWLLHEYPNADSAAVFDSLAAWSGISKQSEETGSLFTKLVCRYKLGGMLQNQDIPDKPGDYVKWSVVRKDKPSAFGKYVLIFVIAAIALGFIFMLFKHFQKKSRYYVLTCPETGKSVNLRLEEDEKIFLGQQVKPDGKIFDIDAPNYWIVIGKVNFVLNNSSTGEKTSHPYGYDVPITSNSGEVLLKIKKIEKTPNQQRQITNGLRSKRNVKRGN